MKFDKFLEILKVNEGLSESLELDILNFKDEFEGSEDITSIIFDIIRTKAIMLLLPLIDKGVGAIHFHIDGDDIIIINTNQPLCKMYFAAIHDFYHIVFQNNDDHDGFDIHLNSQTYNVSSYERRASLFAASLLMPKNQLKKAYNMFRNYTDDLEEIIVRLMIKFNAPFEAVLLRLYETGIKKDLEEARFFMELSDEDIERTMGKYHLSKHIMKPTLVRDISLFDKYKDRIMNRQLFNERDLEILLEELIDYVNKITIGEL